MSNKLIIILVLIGLAAPALAVQLGGPGHSTGEKVQGSLEAKAAILIGNGNITGNNRLQVNVGASVPTWSIMLKSSVFEFDSEGGDLSDVNLRLASDADISYPALYFTRSRGTLASPTVVQKDDKIGEIIFIAYYGAEFQKAATIRASVDGDPVEWGVPGRLSFFTSPDTGTGEAPVARMTIKNSGNVGIGTTEPSSKLMVAGTIEAAAGFRANNQPGLTGTYNFYAVNTGEVESLSFTGGILTDVATKAP